MQNVTFCYSAGDYLHSGLCKVRLIQFSFSKNYLCKKGVSDFFGWPAAEEDLLVAATVSDCWILFCIGQIKALSSTQLKVFVFAGELSLVKLSIFMIALFTTVQSIKDFPLILFQGKIANLFWHAI